MHEMHPPLCLTPIPNQPITFTMCTLPEIMYIWPRSGCITESVMSSELYTHTFAVLTVLVYRTGHSRWQMQRTRV